MYVPLPTPPLDTLSCLLFSPDNVLAVSTYDESVLLYNCQASDGLRPQLAARISAPSAALKMVHTRARTTFAGLADGSVRPVDYENMKMDLPVLAPKQTLSGAISGLQCIPNQNNIVASSLDGTLSILDPRAPRVCHQAGGTKILAMDTTAKYITVARAALMVDIYDFRAPDKPLQTRASGLRFQVCALRILPSEEGYALSSIDGRVAVEYFSDDFQQEKYAFKCHRTKADGADMVHAVTEVLFHPLGSMFTSGGDGCVCVWNWRSRKRMKQFPPLPGTPHAISHMDISADGTTLALGASDDLYMRRADFDDRTALEPSRVFIRLLGEAEVRPRTE